jgi:hypothetical protein
MKQKASFALPDIDYVKKTTKEIGKKEETGSPSKRLRLKLVDCS